MLSRFSRQLVTLFWTVVTVAICFVRLPLLSLYYLSTATRQHPNWTYRQAIGVETLRVWFRYASKVKFHFPISLGSGRELERFVIIEPSTRQIYAALPNASESNVKPEPIGGTWYPKLYNSREDATRQVILHFHGGGYVLGSTRDSECRSAALNLCKNLNAFSFFPQYRLASSPSGRFPAALQDALTAYAYLINIGVQTSNIVLSGDSAGGHLVVMLLRYLSENSGLLGNPRAALLWSPWLNLAVDVEDIDHCRNNSTDFVLGAFVKWAVESFVPPGMDLMHRYLSPFHHPFTTATPIWIQVGGREVLYEEIMSFADCMRKREGNTIDILAVSYAPHDILLASNVLGFENELENATKIAARFLERTGN
ncbi:MAG: hypothetical protein Q9205_002566 [Flavoplaca limonia]